MATGLAQPTHQQNACCVYDFTANIETGKDLIIRQLKDHCKKWVFQLEKGEESGYLHYQGRMSLMVKKRLNQVIKMNIIPGAHISLTSTENHNNDFYVTKSETRIEGPWSDKDMEIPRHLRDEPTWYEWQKYIVDRINVYEERTVNIIYDPKGCQGKSFLASWLGVRGLARRIPVLNDSKDVMRMVMDCPKSKVYFVDMPRAASKKNLHNFYAAIEDVKNGYAYDDRYKFKEEYFDPPQVWVFTNELPDTSLLSKDRWRVWTIFEQTKVLVRVLKPGEQVL